MPSAYLPLEKKADDLMLNIQSYTVVHYGVDYIAWALRSILPFVEQAHVFYTPHSTHNFQSKIKPPETRDQILKEASRFEYAYNHKLRWHDTLGFRYEGEQRDYAVQVCKEAGADIVIVIDVDEIWDVFVLEQALEIVKAGNTRNWLINFTHLWRSFNYACKDNNWPVRFIDLRQEPDSQSVGYIPNDLGEIYHFGYAVTDKIMVYKWKIHGHKNELRSIWFEEKWNNWIPGIEDVHPTNARNWWFPKSFDKTRLPEYMKEHPFYEREMIR